MSRTNIIKNVPVWDVFIHRGIWEITVCKILNDATNCKSGVFIIVSPLQFKKPHGGLPIAVF